MRVILFRSLKTVIFSIALILIVILAIPMCVFLIPIVLIWKLTDILLDKIDNLIGNIRQT